MNVQQIIARWLAAHGYDGLHNQVLGCWCSAPEILPFDCPQPDCEPGHRVACTAHCRQPGCDAPGEYLFHIVPDSHPGAAARQTWRHAWRMVRVCGFGISEFQLCPACMRMAQLAERCLVERTIRYYYYDRYNPDVAIELRRQGQVSVWRVGHQLMLSTEACAERARAIRALE